VSQTQRELVFIRYSTLRAVPVFLLAARRAAGSRTRLAAQHPCCDAQQTGFKLGSDCSVYARQAMLVLGAGGARACPCARAREPRARVPGARGRVPVCARKGAGGTGARARAREQGGTRVRVRAREQGGTRVRVKGHSRARVFDPSAPLSVLYRTILSQSIGE